MWLNIMGLLNVHVPSIEQNSIFLDFIPPFLFYFYYLDLSVSKIKKQRKTKEKLRNDASNIFTSEDIENTSLISRM